MKIVKTVLLKVYEPNKEKKEALDRTLSLYAEVLKFYLEVIKKAGIYRVVSLRKKQALTFLESITVSTKSHPNPPYPIGETIKTPVQTNIRRSAINKAYGMIKSYVSNLKNWYKEGKELGHSKPSYPNPKNFSLTYYATDVELQDIFLRDGKGLHFVRLKVLSESGDYRKRNYPVKVYKRLFELMDKGYVPKNTATLIKKDKDFYIALTLEKIVKKKKQPKKPKTIINVDLNIERNLACIGVFDIDWKRKDSKLERIHFINGELLRLVKKRDYLLELVRIKQKLTGRSPTREDNKRLWRKINNLNKDIALKTAREIAKVAREYEDAIVVFEKLKGLIGEKKKKSKKLNRKLNFWLRKKITDRVKELSVEEDFSVDFVYPGWTSKKCSLCGAKGERFSPSGSTALFRCLSCGYTVNADVNAVFNQHFLYLSHLLTGRRDEGGRRDSVVSPETSLKSSRKRTQSKGSLKSNSYFCV